jgi:hypothetical protein
MNNSILTLPDLDDEAVLKLHDFLYELLEAFESHYSHQIQRYKRDLRIQLLQNELENLFEDDDELSF